MDPPAEGSSAEAAKEHWAFTVEAPRFRGLLPSLNDPAFIARKCIDAVFNAMMARLIKTPCTMLPRLSILSTKPDLLAGKLGMALRHLLLNLIDSILKLLASRVFSMTVFMYPLNVTAMVAVTLISGRRTKIILVLRRSPVVTLRIPKLTGTH